MKKYLLALLLLLFTSLALASTPNQVSNPTISSQAVTEKTDLSIAALSSFFGTVSGVLAGTSGQMFGKLIYQFNQGLLVVAGCWLGFSGLGMVFKSAAHGSFMQQDNKIPLIALRISLGFGLLIPNPSTGYTLLQGIVMQVTVQGVKLADQIWEYGLDYLNAGGAIWSSPQIQDTSEGKSIITDSDSKAILGKTDEGSANLENFSNLGLIQKIMAMEACMIQASIDQDKQNNDNSSDDSNSIANSTSSSEPFSVNENLKNYRYEFPASSTSGDISCGYIAWNQIAKSGASPKDCSWDVNDPDNPGNDNSQCNFSRLALREVVFEILPAVKQYMCKLSGSDDQNVCGGINTDNDITPYMTDAMFGGTINWVNLIQPVVRKDSTGENNRALGFITQAKKEGWMSAGRYYWDLMRIEDSYANARNASYQNYLPTDTGGVIYPQGKAPANDLLSKTDGTDGYIAKVNTQMHAFGVASDAFNVTPPKVEGQAMGILWKILSVIMSPLAQLLALFTKGNSVMGGLGADPILWLHHVGMSCLSVGGTIWIGTAVAMFMVLLTTNICNSVSSLGAAAKGLFDWIQPILMATATGFIVVGVSLGFYMPLYPYMLFTFGVIGWLIAVAEAMVAAPLVAFGITHPEGHDFLGSAKQGMMLLLGIFLRPSLMVIGLFGGMILCQVAMGIAVHTFTGFISDLFALAPAKGAASGDVLGAVSQLFMNVSTESVASGGLGGLIGAMMCLVIFPLFLSIFTVFVYTIVTTSFSLIFHLPDYIMLWIGAPQAHGQNAAQLADQVKQSVMGGVAKGASSVSDAASSGYKERRGEQKANEREEKRANNQRGVNV